MMTMQARDMLTPYRSGAHPLRAYPIDSPRAGARLVVLALLADGRLEVSELEGLARQGIFDRLGLSREDFYQVLFDFCRDAEKLPDGKGNYLLTPATMSGLFDEVRDRRMRRAVVTMVLDVIRSDGRLDDAEESFYLYLLEAWGIETQGMYQYGLGWRREQTRVAAHPG